MDRLRSQPRNVAAILGRMGGPSVAVALLILLIICLFVVPLPRYVLDLLLVVNLTASLILLLTGLLVTDPLRLFAFPTILLITTLFRLSLNVSSTRLILLHGDRGLDAAGHVIQSFGSFVVQGDFVVGAIIFAVIAIINYLVITKGSSRVAEVSARFTLDAMPGKQLSIDQDLRAGNISQEHAVARREELQRESQFYGAMDGAMKFVQGDAIAGFIIVFINAVGGVSIGLGRQMPFAEAVNTFGVLTIGDGLVNLIPSLMISVCAGLVVTHVSGQTSARTGARGDVLAQIFSEPPAIALAALALMLLGLTTAFPAAPALAVGLPLLYLSLRLGKVESQSELLLRKTAGTGKPAGSELKGLVPAADRLRVVCIEVSSDLLEQYFVSSVGGLHAFEQFSAAKREEIFRRRGVRLPQVEISENRGLPRNGYSVLIRERAVRGGVLRPASLFVSASGALAAGFGMKVLAAALHPEDQRSAAWVEASDAGRRCLERIGFEVLSVPEYLAYEGLGAALEEIEEVFGIDEVKALVSPLKSSSPGLYEELFGAPLVSYPELTELLRRLVRERVSIRDLKLILEAVAEFNAVAGNKEDRAQWLSDLHAAVRQVLARSIVGDALHPSGELRTFILSFELEEEFRSAIRMWDNLHGRPPIEPQLEASLRANAQKLFGPVLERGATPVVILCSADIRPAVQEFFKYQRPSTDWYRTISFEELDYQQTKPQSVGMLTV